MKNERQPAASNPQPADPAPSTQASPPPRRREGDSWTTWLLLLAAFCVIYWLVSARESGPLPPSAVTWQTDFAAASAQARQRNTVIFADFGADWCAPCRTMEHRVFSKPEFAAQLEELAVPLRVDLSDQSSGPGAALAGKYRVISIPTYLVLSPDGKPLARGEGVLSIEEVLDLVRKAKDTAAATSL